MVDTAKVFVTYQFSITVLGSITIFAVGIVQCCPGWFVKPIGPTGKVITGPGHFLQVIVGVICVPHGKAQPEIVAVSHGIMPRTLLALRYPVEPEIGMK